MKPFIISWGNYSNQLLREPTIFIQSIMINPSEIDSPELLEDQVSEWLGQHGNKFPRSRSKSVVMLTRDYKPGWFTSKGIPCLRIYYEGLDSHSLFLLVAIGFKNTEISLIS